MQERRRKLHGVPKRVRGQFDFERREPSTALSATMAADGAFTTGSDGLLTKRFDGATDGGYDSIELDPKSRAVRILQGGVPHNSAGAAAWSWDGEQRVSSWWMHGNQVDQVAVARVASGEPEVFDADFEEGWGSTVAGVTQLLERAGSDADAQDSVLSVSRTLDQPVSDDEVHEDPVAAAQALGAARAARLMRKGMLQAVLDGTDWKDAVRSVAGGAEEFLSQNR